MVEFFEISSVKMLYRYMKYLDQTVRMSFCKKNTVKTCNSSHCKTGQGAGSMEGTNGECGKLFRRKCWYLKGNFRTWI